MANIPLQSISFPGLSDKYTTPTVDATLTQTGAAADAKKTGDEIGAIKNDLSDGTMTVNNAENAEQLTSTVGIEDTVPYLFRTSGGSNDIGDREDVRKIVGGTIVNNQLITTPSDGTTVVNGITKTIYNGGTAVKISGTATENIYNLISISVPVISGHKYIFINNYVGTPMNGNVWQIYAVGGVPTTYEVKTKILQATSDDACNIRMAVYNNTEVDITMDFPQVTDLTKDFGTAIADYVYSLEQATAGAGVAWLKKHFPKQFDAGYQAYDAGTLKSIEGLSGKKTVGFNQFDKSTAVDGKKIKSSTGEEKSNSTWARSDYIRVIPNTIYYTNAYGVGQDYTVTLYDSNKNYIGYSPTVSAGTFNTGDANYVILSTIKVHVSVDELVLNLSWDGERDGQYEPYKEYTYALDSSLTLRGIPKVDASGNLYYDGDEYLPDGTVNRRYREIDFDGNERWTLQSINSSGIANFSYDLGANNTYTNGDRAVCNRFTAQTTPIADVTKEGFMLAAGQYLYIRISSSEADTVTGLKTWLASNPTQIMYELATPTTETALPYQETQIVDDFGTEEFVLADGAFPVPVGHNTMYQNNLRAKLEMSPDSPDGDGLYVVQQESGENTYVPLASTATIQDILTRLTALENA